MQDGKELFIQHLISVLESKDFYAENHSIRVRKCTEILLARLIQFCPEYKLTKQNCEQIAFAAMVHDIGKISLTAPLLHKPGKLDDEEEKRMQNHTKRGQQIFLQLLHNMSKEQPDYGLFRCCAEVCLYHHERFDGSGYPRGLEGNNIPLSAQVVGLADAYDNLVNERIYKPAYSKNEAFMMLAGGECGAFNPRLLDVFTMARMDIEKIFPETGTTKG